MRTFRFNRFNRVHYFTFFDTLEEQTSFHGLSHRKILHRSFYVSFIQLLTQEAWDYDHSSCELPHHLTTQNMTTICMIDTKGDLGLLRSAREVIAYTRAVCEKCNWKVKETLMDIQESKLRYHFLLLTNTWLLCYRSSRVLPVEKLNNWEKHCFDFTLNIMI